MKKKFIALSVTLLTMTFVLASASAKTIIINNNLAMTEKQADKEKKKVSGKGKRHKKKGKKYKNKAKKDKRKVEQKQAQDAKR